MSRRESPRQSSTLTSLPITSGLTSDSAPTPTTSSAQASVSVQPQQNLAAGIHRNALTTGTIGGVSVAIVATVITIMVLVLRLRRRRRDRRDRDTNVEARMVSPLVRLTSGTTVCGPEIPAHSPGTRLQYLEKEIRKTQGRIVEIDARTQVLAETSTPAVNVSAVESSSNGPPTTETDGEVAALRARIRELETQSHGAWALGLSDDPPPGYTA
ncbi:hypothetical protein B0H13DRAFT_2380693 [Mycena leptocephala]|nr:hypothetical protein B0H13DRAFT_2380693 [Mycena leptocephala]